ncbi:cyanophycinase [Candidatus Sumerlaeota bacterium]|nr:cyanophycinase [Candidatus Sumerlaeota bacterium]
MLRKSSILLPTLCHVALCALPLRAAAQENSGPRPTKPDNLTVYLTGDAADSPRQPVGGPAVLLMGGSSEVDAAFATQAYPILNGGDIVVLRTSGADGYNDYLYDLVSGALKPNSVETIIPDTVAKANTDYVEWACRSAEMIWFAGGDQSEYTDNWRGTKLQAAVQEAYNRGAVIGGTSAGMAIMGEFIFAPAGSAPTGQQALANPHASGNTLVAKLINSPLMEDIITDTHFHARDRMGRPLSWMARLREGGTTPRIVAVAGDERASIFINKDRIGHVLSGAAGRAIFVMWEDDNTQRTQVTNGQPLVYSNVLRTKLYSGDTFDFNTMSGTKAPIRLSVNGAANPPFNPADPYGDGPLPTATPSPTSTATPEVVMTPQDAFLVN